jgi:16S rRNA (guanine527-N7)-methyltransferase
MKGPSVDAELKSLPDGLSREFSLSVDRQYTLPGTAFRRRLVVFEKTHPVRKRTYRILTRAGETMGTVITSPVNSTFKELKALNASDGVKKSGKTIVAGRRQVLDVARRRGDLCDGLVIFDGLREEDDGINELIRAFDDSGRLVLLKKSLFNEIDQFATGAPLLVARTPALGPWDRTCDEGCTLLVPFQDPANVGTVLRSAVAFGVRRAVLLREAAHPYHPRAVRSSSGAVFQLNLQRGPSIDEVCGICRERSLDILTLDREGEPVHSFSFPDRFLLLPGLEGPGLPAQLRARSLGIPMSGGVESLNAAVAASIALYAWRTHRQSSGSGFTSP